MKKLKRGNQLISFLIILVLLVGFIAFIGLKILIPFLFGGFSSKTLNETNNYFVNQSEQMVAQYNLSRSKVIYVCDWYDFVNMKPSHCHYVVQTIHYKSLDDINKNNPYMGFLLWLIINGGAVFVLLAIGWRLFKNQYKGNL